MNNNLEHQPTARNKAKADLKNTGAILMNIRGTLKPVTTLREYDTITKEKQRRFEQFMYNNLTPEQ